MIQLCAGIPRARVVTPRYCWYRLVYSTASTPNPDSLPYVEPSPDVILRMTSLGQSQLSQLSQLLIPPPGPSRVPVGSYEHHIAQLGQLILIVEVLLFGAQAVV